MMGEKENLDSWFEWLDGLMAGPSWEGLSSFLAAEEKAGKEIYPPKEQWFAAFSMAKALETKAVILGQDPYHGPDQAMGLCFSVKKEMKAPPSLRNIFKEVASDIGKAPQTHDLSAWGEQGVLLLNSVMTVERAKAASHKNQGWETFTDGVIQRVSAKAAPSVFLLWGAFAHQKEPLIDGKRHLILRAPHPSPFSADRGFFGCKHFSKTNAWLRSQGRPEIEWC